MPSYNNSSYRPGNPRSGGGGRSHPPSGGSSYAPSSSGYSGDSSYGNPPLQLQTQQIFIPNDLVGCIIGKGGSKINEIRHMSASQIKIMEPGAVAVSANGGAPPTPGENERLVVITGRPANITMAVQMLYHVSISLYLV